MTPATATRDPAHEKMMSRGVGRSVRITCLGKHSAGEVRVQIWSDSARLARAAKTLGASWGLALLSVLAPIAHFVLVPLFFLAGPIAAFFVGRQRSAVLGGEGTCPSCGARFVIGATDDIWPLHDGCAECRVAVRIETV